MTNDDIEKLKKVLKKINHTAYEAYCDLYAFSAAERLE